MTTGNEIVDKVGEIAITGNIIPQMWYETLKKRRREALLSSHCNFSGYCVLVQAR